LKGKEPEVPTEVRHSPPTLQFNQLMSDKNSNKEDQVVPATDKNGRGKVTIKPDGVEPTNKRSYSKSTGKESDNGKTSKIPPKDPKSNPIHKPEEGSENSGKGKVADSKKSKSRKAEIPPGPTAEKNSKGKKSNSSEGEKSKMRKGGTESPRPASVSSDRSKSTDSAEEVKVEEILAYYPTDEEFQDPLKYISQIQTEAEKFGIARIVPPKSFRVKFLGSLLSFLNVVINNNCLNKTYFQPECNVEDDMRFTAYNHYIHRMNKRWGPNVHVRVGIMENLRKSKVRVSTSNPPMIGGMEVDLTTLYHTVQSFGGLTEVIQKDKWNKVSDAMHIPKAANDRASKLDAIYVKYVLPYEMLSESKFIFTIF